MFKAALNKCNIDYASRLAVSRDFLIIPSEISTPYNKSSWHLLFQQAYYGIVPRTSKVNTHLILLRLRINYSSSAGKAATRFCQFAVSLVYFFKIHAIWLRTKFIRFIYIIYSLTSGTRAWSNKKAKKASHNHRTVRIAGLYLRMILSTSYK